jgi:predicted sulfurtransferase
MLEGGIHSYLEWIKTSDSESLYSGGNYVFDARCVSPGVTAPVSLCFCDSPSSRYTKCAGFGCHLLKICCKVCSNKLDDVVYCCKECEEKKEGDKLICICERKRRSKLLVFDPHATEE